MVTYTITLSDAENKALGYVAVSQQAWIDNAIHERCRIAIEKIVLEEINRITAIGGSISGTKEDIVNSSSIKSLAEIQAEYESQQALKKEA
jgi:hypothetical protein